MSEIVEHGGVVEVTKEVLEARLLEQYPVTKLRDYLDGEPALVYARVKLLAASKTLTLEAALRPVYHLPPNELYTFQRCPKGSIVNILLNGVAISQQCLRRMKVVTYARSTGKDEVIANEAFTVVFFVSTCEMVGTTMYSRNSRCVIDTGDFGQIIQDSAESVAMLESKGVGTWESVFDQLYSMWRQLLTTKDIQFRGALETLLGSNNFMAQGTSDTNNKTYYGGTADWVRGMLGALNSEASFASLFATLESLPPSARMTFAASTGRFRTPTRLDENMRGTMTGDVLVRQNLSELADNALVALTSKAAMYSQLENLIANDPECVVVPADIIFRKSGKANNLQFAPKSIFTSTAGDLKRLRSALAPPAQVVATPTQTAVVSTQDFIVVDEDNLLL